MEGQNVVNNNPWVNEEDDGIYSYLNSFEQSKGHIALDLPNFTDFSVSEEGRLTCLSTLTRGHDSGLHTIQSDSSCENSDTNTSNKFENQLRFAEGFELLADQFERNNKMEVIIDKLELLNKYPNALRKNGKDALTASIRLLIDSLNYAVERQAELSNRLTEVTNQSSEIESIPVHADDQLNVIKCLSQIVSFVNKFKDHLAKSEQFPLICSQLDQLIPSLLPEESSVSSLQNQFEEIEEARATLMSVTRVSSMHNQSRVARRS